jgi:hypothetical protein
MFFLVKNNMCWILNYHTRSENHETKLFRSSYDLIRQMFKDLLSKDLILFDSE